MGRSAIPLPSALSSSPAVSTHKPNLTIVARRDGRRSGWKSGWRRNRDKRSGSSLAFAAIAITSVATLALTGAVGAITAAFAVPAFALGIAGFAVLSSLTAVFAIIGPLLLFFIPFFGFPLALFVGASGFAFGGLGGAVRTALDVVLTLGITGNFVGALIGRARRKREEESDEEEELPLGEQIRRVAMAQVEQSLKDMRATIPRPPEKEKKNVKKESAEELAVRQAKEAQEALTEVASADWFGPTVLSVVPGLNGLAWFAASDAFPTAVQGPRRSTFVRNALVYGSPALLFLLAAPFQGFSFMGFARGEAWWLSLVFGLVHLQLERKDMVDEARVRVAQTALPEPKPEDELERVERELKEFDSQLSSLAWWNESPSKWTEANVGKWLKDEGLERLVGNFAEHNVDGSVLLDLKGPELRDELGITSLGDRKRVLAAIDRLRAREMERGARRIKEFDT